MKKQGEMGIGTLVIFIAMILVAAIAAGTLIQTATSLQNKALATGKAAQQSVSTNAMVLDVERRANSENASILEYHVKVKLAPGSDGIKLTGSLLSIEANNASYELLYSDQSCTYNETTGYFTDMENANGTYTVKYLISGSRKQMGYFQNGDIINICFAFPKMYDRDRVRRMDFVPSSGIPTTIFGRK